MADIVLEVKNLSITFFTKQGALPTVDSLSGGVPWASWASPAAARA